MGKEFILTVLGIFFFIGVTSAQISRFVKVGGTGDGSTWETAAPDFITAALEPTSDTAIYIFVAEGDYGDINFDRDGGDIGNESNLPDGKDVFIYGGYSDQLTGTIKCDYDPGKYIVSVTPDGSANGGESVFRMDDTDGNLTVKGMQFINPQNDNVKFGSVLTVDDRVNGTILFEDIYIIGHDADPGDGAFHFRDGASGNIFTINNMLAEDNINTTLSAQTSTTNNTFNVNKSYFLNNHDSSGGAILIRSNTDNPNLLQIDSSYFCDNRATQNQSGGGAISIQDRTKAIVTNSFFFNNMADNNGGAINVIIQSELVSKNNYYRGNSATEGGSIAIASGSLHSTNDIFYGNTASSLGGGIRIDDEANMNPHIIIQNATFYQNNGNNYGGGLYITGGVVDSIPQIIGSAFCLNTSNNGAAIAFEGNNSLHAQNNTFISNTAANDGGAIYIDRSAQITGPANRVIECHFESNTAGVRGGAMYVTNLASSAGIHNLEIKDSDFKSNMAGDENTNCRGGAIMLNAPFTRFSSGKIENCNFENNKSRYGGAIASRINNSVFTLNSTFWDNEAWSLGGAILYSGSTGSVPYTSSDGVSRSFMTEGCVFHSNLAGTVTGSPNSNGGGAVFVEETINNRVYIYNTEFYENSAFIGRGTAASFNRRGGGAINVEDNSLFKNVTFRRNTINTVNYFPEAQGGSDVQDWGDDLLTFENCEMQMPQGLYANSGWLFDNATIFNQNSTPGPSKPTSITSKICTTPDDLVCGTGTNIFNQNLPTTINLEANCTNDMSEIGVTLNNLHNEDFPIMFTWIPPVAAPTSGTANQLSDLELSNFTKIGEYTLQIMDNRGCKDTASITMNTVSCAALPVQLFDFRLENSDSDIVLMWKTASETNNSHFNIERSVNGTNWNKIGEVLGKETTESESQYRYIDQNVHSAYSTLYYRLNQIDYNGSSTYSEIRSIDLTQHHENIKIYPNPAKSVIHVSGLRMKDYRIELHNALGKLLKVSHQAIINISEFQEGVYIIIIMDAKNDVIHTEKIVIAK